MDQITITRAEYREKIAKNPRGYGIVRYLREHPEKQEQVQGDRKLKMFLEELTQHLLLREIEFDLFGEPGEGDAAEKDGDPDNVI